MTNPSPIPTQVEVESVDTPELRRLVLSIRDAKHALAISARTEMLIAHIESIITARVAAAEAKGSDNLRQSIDRMLRDTINAGDEPLSLAQMIWTIRERLAASQAAPAKAEGWMPIETAPKDGRTLLLGRFNELGKWRAIRGQWSTQASIDDGWEDPDGFEEGWYETAIEPDVPNYWSINPTHWMAIPAAPSTPLGEQT